MKIRKVAIVGGTHGNEYTGTFLLKRWNKNLHEVQRDSFITQLIWANPKAFYENKRYIDTDLNRCFLCADLQDETIITYEGNRAKVINMMLGPKLNPSFDFVIDVHTTTCNMGITLVVFEGDKFNLHLAGFVKSVLPNVNVYYFRAEEDLPYLTSITSKRLALEIGPIAQGLLRHDIFEQARYVVQLALDYVQQYNSQKEPAHYAKEIEVFLHRNTLSFPADADGNICAMIHTDLQDQDFGELRKGDPVFATIDGEIITYDGDDVVYPVLINEAAYYESGIALALTDKTTIPI